MNGNCCGCRTRICEWIVTTAGVTLLTVSAYEATGMTVAGLPGAAGAPLAFGAVFDPREKLSRRLQPASEEIAITRLKIIPARMGIILLVRRDYIITRLTR
jgi:hypothetical protein